MSFIKIGVFKLVYFDKNDKEHLNYVKELLSDKAIVSKFQGIFPALVSKNDFFDKGFFIKYKDELVGCVLFGKYNSSERCMYIRGFAIDKDHRGMKIGREKLSKAAHDEIVEYIFNKYHCVDTIMITVSTENPAGQKAASRYGYSRISDTHYLMHR